VERTTPIKMEEVINGLCPVFVVVVVDDDDYCLF
jgi:hypothetical protein